MLAPYTENIEYSPEYCVFEDKTDEVMEEFKSDGTDVIVYPGGTKFEYPWVFRDEHGLAKGDPLPEGYTLEHRSYEFIFEDFESFINEYHNYTESDVDPGRYGYNHNPNAKWDWFEEGGRWKDYLDLKDGTKADSAESGEVDWEQMFNNKERKDRAKRTWEIVVEESLLKKGEKKEDFVGLFTNKEHLLEKYLDKKTYIKISAAKTTYAVLNDDGWHEAGEMGWFGMSSTSGREEEDFILNYFDNFIKDLDPETFVTVVDCHI